MISFLPFILEADQLKHLPHPEDIAIQGKRGFRQAFGVLHGLHKSLKNKSAKLSTKYDGSPSLVFGIHPETNKPFVATKSAWNKTPKLNYSHDDIKTNHPNSPGLRAKLHMALATLPKVMPKTGIFQGDIMYTKPDIQHHGEKLQVTPNTITYGAHSKSPEGKKMAKARIGLAIHTEYKGKTFDTLQKKPLTNLKAFGSHPHVHLIDSAAVTNVDYSPQHQERTRRFLGGAIKSYKKVDPSTISGHEDHMPIYINQTITTNTRPTVKGYYTHLLNRAKIKKDVRPEHLDQVRKSPSHFENVFRTQRYLELAKNTMIHALDPHNKRFETSIGGKPSGPEGYVLGSHSKIVKRRGDKSGPGFSAGNFAMSKNRKDDQIKEGFRLFGSTIKRKVGHSLPNPIRNTMAGLVTTGKMANPDNAYKREELKKFREKLMTNRKLPKFSDSILKERSAEKILNWLRNHPGEETKKQRKKALEKAQRKFDSKVRAIRISGYKPGDDDI